MTREQFWFGLTVLVLTAVLLCPTATAQTYKVIYNFGIPTVGVGGPPLDGTNPYAGLTFDPQGNLYGTTARGGFLGCLLDGCGMVFRLKPQPGGTWKEQVLSWGGFGTTGTPIAPVVLDHSGNVYGTFACTLDCFNIPGSVFELIRGGDNGTWTEVTLAGPSFNGCGNGVCGVAFDNVGHLYGTSQTSFTYFSGEAFSLDHASISQWYTLVLYGFSGGSDGGGPALEFTFDAGGNIYGTTYSGGAGGNGTVFKLTRNDQGFGWPESVLYSFQGGADGANPNGGVIFDGGGNLYGTTVNGGAAGEGTVFKLTPNGDGSWSESILYSFLGASDGSNPGGPLTFDSSGNLYGVAKGGAHGHGVLFKLTNSGGHWVETILHAFTGGLDGDTPSGGVIFDSAGNLYGTTVYGGAYPTCIDEPFCGGVAYEMTP